jgi:hypothetical protein
MSTTLISNPMKLVFPSIAPAQCPQPSLPEARLQRAFGGSYGRPGGWIHCRLSSRGRSE